MDSNQLAKLRQRVRARLAARRRHLARPVRPVVDWSGIDEVYAALDASAADPDEWQ